MAKYSDFFALAETELLLWRFELEFSESLNKFLK